MESEVDGNNEEEASAESSVQRLASASSKTELPSLFDEEFLLAVDEASAVMPSADPPVPIVPDRLPPPPAYEGAAERTTSTTEPVLVSHVGDLAVREGAVDPQPESPRRRRTTRRLVAPTAVLGNPPIRRLVDADSGPQPLALPQNEDPPGADPSDEPTLEVDLEAVVRAAGAQRVPLRFLKGARPLDMAPVDDMITHAVTSPADHARSKGSHSTVRGVESPLTPEQKAALAGVFEGLEDAEDWPVFPGERQAESPAVTQGGSSSLLEQRPRSSSPLEQRPRSSSPLEQWAGSSSPLEQSPRSSSPLEQRPGSSSPLEQRPRSLSPLEQGESAPTQPYPRVTASPEGSLGGEADATETRTTRRNSVPRFVSALFHIGGPSGTRDEDLLADDSVVAGAPWRAMSPWTQSGVAIAALLLLGVIAWSVRESSWAGDEGGTVVASAAVPVLPSAVSSLPASSGSMLAVPLAHEQSTEAVLPGGSRLEVGMPLSPGGAGAAAEESAVAVVPTASDRGRRVSAHRLGSRKARQERNVPPEEEPVSAIEEDAEPEPAPVTAAQIPAVEQPKTVASLLADSRMAFERQDYESAFRLAMEVRTMKGATKHRAEALRLVARSGCRIGQRGHALRALRKLPLLKRPAVRRDCRREGERLGL